MSKAHCSGSLRVGRVPGYPNYRVLSSGSVWYRRGVRWVRKRAFPDRYGYLQLNLSAGDHKRRFYLHGVVLLAFVAPRPEGKQCRHLDGHKTNNRLENLKWGTAQENQADMVAHGTAPSKLTEMDVLEIRRRVQEGRCGIQGQLARKYGVSDAAISRVVNKKRWRRVR